MDISVVRGGSTLFRVTATGTEPIVYQWYKGNDPIEDSNSSALSLTSIETAAGDYHVIMSNAAGSIVNDTVSLTVQSPPIIIDITESASLIEGENVELSVTA